jgi:hypothetical protein
VVTLNAYASSIQDIVNTSMIGTITRPKQRKVPTNESGDAVVKVSFSNKKTRKFVDNLDNLIDFIFSAPEDTEMNRTWKTMINNYRDAMIIVRQPNEYSDEDIIEFQTKIDDFFISYIENSGAGKEGITNYMHMLGSSHISYYMQRHRNLYKYSQQGWESMNEKFQRC